METNKKIIAGVLITIMVLFVGFVVFLFAPCKDTVESVITFRTNDAGTIQANITVEYTVTPRGVYKSGENQDYFRGIMKRETEWAGYKELFEDVQKKTYFDVRNNRDVLNKEIINVLGDVQFERYEPIVWGDEENIDVRDTYPPSSCWLEVKNVKCEFVLDSMIEKNIDKRIKAQEEVEQRAKELNEANEKLNQLKK